MQGRLHQVSLSLLPERWRVYLQCVLGMKAQVNSCLKQFHLKQHLNNANKEQARKSFCTLNRLKRVRLNAGGVFHQAKLFHHPGILRGCTLHC